jgi:hypothetical protein
MDDRQHGRVLWRQKFVGFEVVTFFTDEEVGICDKRSHRN